MVTWARPFFWAPSMHAQFLLGIPTWLSQTQVQFHMPWKDWPCPSPASHPRHGSTLPLAINSLKTYPIAYVRSLRVILDSLWSLVPPPIKHKSCPRSNFPLAAISPGTVTVQPYSTSRLAPAAASHRACIPAPTLSPCTEQPTPSSCSYCSPTLIPSEASHFTEITIAHAHVCVYPILLVY